MSAVTVVVAESTTDADFITGLAGVEVVTPRNLEGVRGLRINGVLFAQSATYLPLLTRFKIADAIAPGVATSPDAVRIYHDMALWVVSAA